MTTKVRRQKYVPVRSERRTEVPPPKPDERLWKEDKVRAFEAGVQWFLAVSRVA